MADSRSNHRYASVDGAGHARCSCGWASASRVGRATVAREHYKRHVADQRASA